MDDKLLSLINTPNSLVALEMMAKHKDFLNLVVNGNKTIERKMVIFINEVAGVAYSRALSDSVKTLNEFLETTPALPPLDLGEPTSEYQLPLDLEPSV